MNDNYTRSNTKEPVLIKYIIPAIMENIARKGGFTYNSNNSNLKGGEIDQSSIKRHNTDNRIDRKEDLLKKNRRLLLF